MAERSHFLAQDSTEQDSRLGVAALFARDTGLTVAPGVLSGLAVTQTGSASASVSVAAGTALNQATSAIGGAYLETLDTAKTVDVLSVNPAESSPRNDLIVYESGLAVGSKVHVVKGTAGAIPVDPSVPAQAVALARVRVKTAATYGGSEIIVNADIDDLRAFTGPGGRVPLVQTFTSSGTWTKPAGAIGVHVRCVGGGGGGGVGVGAGTGQGQGGGGGGGGYVEKTFAAADLGSTVAVTIGAGGPGNAGDGDTGGNTTFSTLTASGGVGGAAMTSTTGNAGAVGGAGGAASGGDVNSPGSDGGTGKVLSGQSLNNGYGGGSRLAGQINAPTSIGAGSNGRAYGGGGAGAFVTTASQVGGNGAPGVCIVTTIF